MKKRYKRKPKPRTGGGSQHFIGWAWVCPRCGKKVRTVYLPVRRHEGTEALRHEGVEDDAALCSLRAFVPMCLRACSTFACYSCHRIRSFSRIDAKNSWNELVSYLSGGLMYGREVEMPAGFASQEMRKREYRPRLVKPRRKAREELAAGSSQFRNHTARHPWALQTGIGVK